MGGSTSTPKSYLAQKVDQFLGHKQDYDWFMEKKGGAHGEDIDERRVVVTTFPLDITKTDFEDYVDKKFCDRDETTRKKITALFRVINDCDLEKNVTFNYETDGEISAVLTQILFERDTPNGKIKISVGYTKCVRRVKSGSHFEYDYWKSNEEKVTKALQYLYGRELKQELALIC